MSYKVVFSPAASDDLEDLYIYLATEMGIEPAREYVGKIKAYCLGFATFPHRGCSGTTSGPCFGWSDIDARQQLLSRLKGTWCG